MYSQTEKQKEEKYCFRIGRRAQIIDKGLVGAPGFEPGTSCAQGRTALFIQIAYFQTLTVQLVAANLIETY